MATNHRGDPIKPDPIKTCVHCQREAPEVDQSLKLYMCKSCNTHAKGVFERANRMQ